MALKNTLEYGIHLKICNASDNTVKKWKYMHDITVIYISVTVLSRFSNSVMPVKYFMLSMSLSWKLSLVWCTCEESKTQRCKTTTKKCMAKKGTELLPAACRVYAVITRLFS